MPLYAPQKARRTKAALEFPRKSTSLRNVFILFTAVIQVIKLNFHVTFPQNMSAVVQRQLFFHRAHYHT